jgi:hypothetical protein
VDEREEMEEIIVGEDVRMRQRQRQSTSVSLLSHHLILLLSRHCCEVGEGEGEGAGEGWVRASPCIGTLLSPCI